MRKINRKIPRRRPLTTKAQITKAIAGITKRIAIERDKLRDVLSDAESILDTSDDAVQRLEEAADVLSQYL